LEIAKNAFFPLMLTIDPSRATARKQRHIVAVSGYHALCV
jgi:hypothetical protein